MSTIILLNENGTPYTVDAASVQPVFRVIENACPPKIMAKKTLFGGIKTVSVPEYAEPTVLEAPSILVTTSMINGSEWSSNTRIKVHGVSFTEYADLLTKSSNGVVDLRPAQRANATQQTAQHAALA